VVSAGECAHDACADRPRYAHARYPFASVHGLERLRTSGAAMRARERVMTGRADL